MYGDTPVLVATIPVPEEIREWYPTARRVDSREAVTVIELLSPTNKRSGRGRTLYQRKRQDVLGTETSLVEIDLLRSGEPVPAYLHTPPDASPPGGYRILVARGRQRPNADIVPFTVRQPIPDFPLPLLPEDEEPPVSFQRVLHALYDELSYNLLVDYHASPAPPLNAEDAAWADRLLRAALRC